MRKPFSDTITHACALALVMCPWAAAQQKTPISVPPPNPVAQDKYEPQAPSAPEKLSGRKNQAGFPLGNQRVRGRLILIDPATGKPQPVNDTRLKVLWQWRAGSSIVSSTDGGYGLGNVAPGVYSVIARGPNAFAAFSVNLHADSGVHDSTQRPIDLVIAAVPPTNLTQTKELLELAEPTPDWDRTAVRVQPDEGRQDGDVRLVLSSYQIAQLTKDSRLTGRIHRLDPITGRDLPILNSTVHLLRNNHIVSRQKLNEDGSFSMKYIRPAVYSLVASGEDGFLAISVDVVPAKASRRRGPAMPVRFQEGQGQEFGVEAAFVPTQLVLEDDIIEDEGFPVVIDQGGAGFVGATGGGGSATGGGLASVLVGTGIGVLLATDDDDDRTQASPSSP